MKFKFLTDASTDIPEKAMKDYDISIIPIEVRFGEETFSNGLSNREFYGKMAETGIVPKTSMPNSFKFQEFYKDYVNQNDVFIFTIVISMELSTTKVQAQMAADELGMKNVFIEEGKGAAIATGAIIVELAKFAQTTNDIEKIKAKFYELRDKVKLFAVINDLKYLRASGRLSGASATLGTMLKIKPIVSIVNGKVVNIAKCMGDIKAEAFLIDSTKNMDEHRPLYLLHTDYPERINQVYLKHKFKLPQAQEVDVCEIGCIVGSHVGAKCYGFCFFEK